MSKVTLYVKDEAVIVRAKRLAKAQGRSVSDLVEQFLSSLGAAPDETPARAPILRQLQATLRRVHVREADYDAYREKKYG